MGRMMRTTLSILLTALLLYLAAAWAEAEAFPAGDGAEETYINSDGNQGAETEVTQTSENDPAASGENDLLPAASDENDLSENIVYTQSDLAAWLESHVESGGRVTLGNTITLTKLISPNDLYEKRITIDTGQYGLVYDGGSIHMYGLEGWEIVGEGVDVPVLDVYNVGGWYMHWLQAVEPLEVTAVGRDGAGGIAVRISRNDGYSVNLDAVTDTGLIRSSGEGAVGLYLSAPMDAYCLSVKTEGAGSTAVYAAQGTNLRYCRLEADGDGAKVISGHGDIVLDTCSASPVPQDVSIVNRHIVDIIGKRFYFPRQQYSDGNTHFDGHFTFLLSGNDDFPSVSETLGPIWESDPRDVDTGTLGKTIIQGSLPPPFQGLGLEGEFPLKLVVDVRDPSIPCISEMQFLTSYEGEDYVLFNFWDSYDPSDKNVILWRSDDNGASWYDFTHSPKLKWEENYLYFYYGKITGPILLQLEYAGAGESNVVSLYSIDGNVGGDVGGDRTGTDRVVKDSSSDNGSPGQGTGSHHHKSDDGNDRTRDDGNGGSETQSGTGDEMQSSTGDEIQPATGDEILPGGVSARNDGAGGATQDKNNAGGKDIALAAAIPVTAQVSGGFSASPGPGSAEQIDSVEQTDSSGTPAGKGTPQKQDIASSDIPVQSPEASSIDLHVEIVLTAAAVILLSGLFIWRRLLKTRR